MFRALGVISDKEICEYHSSWTWSLTSNTKRMLQNLTSLYHEEAQQASYRQRRSDKIYNQVTSHILLLIWIKETGAKKKHEFTMDVLT